MPTSGDVARQAPLLNVRSRTRTLFAVVVLDVNAKLICCTRSVFPDVTA